MGSFFGGGGGSSTTTSGLGPGFGWVAPGLSSLYRQLTGILQGGANPYPYTMPDQSVAGLNNTQLGAMSALRGMAPGQAALGTSGSNFLESLEGGKYMDPNNAALTGAVGAMNNATTASYENATAPSTASQFTAAGEGGGSAYANAKNANQYSLASELSNNANQVIGQNYFTNLGLMEQAPSEFSAVQNAQTQPWLTALNVGNQKQNQQQNQLNTQYQNEYNRASWPYQAVGMIQNLLQGTTGFGGITKAMSGGGGLS